MNRGEFSLPLQSIYKLALYSYSYFKLIDNKECAMKVIRGFREVYDMLDFEIENSESIFSLLVNCFSKVYSIKKIDSVKRSKAEKKNEVNWSEENSPFLISELKLFFLFYVC